MVMARMVMVSREMVIELPMEMESMVMVKAKRSKVMGYNLLQ
jgi:hypothetical protein